MLSKLLLAGVIIIGQGFETYQEQSKDYSIDFPQSWVKDKNYDQADILVREPKSAGFPANCNVISKKASTEIAAIDFYERSFVDVQQIPSFVEIQRGFLPMSKERMAWISFERNVYNFDYVTHSYLFAEGVHSFVITCIAKEEDYAKFKDIFHQIASSFDFAN